MTTLWEPWTSIDVDGWLIEVGAIPPGWSYRVRCTAPGAAAPEFERAGFATQRRAEEAGWQYIVLASGGHHGVRVKSR